MARPFAFRHAGLAARPTWREYVAGTRTADCWWNSGQKWALALKLAVSSVSLRGEQTLAACPPVALNISYRLLLSTELYPQRRTLRAVDSFAISFTIKWTRRNRHETIHQGLQRNIFTSLGRCGLVVDSSICLRSGALEQIDRVWDIEVLESVGFDGFGEVVSAVSMRGVSHKGGIEGTAARSKEQIMHAFG